MIEKKEEKRRKEKNTRLFRNENKLLLYSLVNKVWEEGA